MPYRLPDAIRSDKNLAVQLVLALTCMELPPTGEEAPHFPLPSGEITGLLARFTIISSRG